jgi:hypothetical protein
VPDQEMEVQILSARHSITCLHMLMLGERFASGDALPLVSPYCTVGLTVSSSVATMA